MTKISKVYLPLALLLIFSLGCGFSVNPKEPPPPTTETSSGGETVQPTATVEQPGGETEEPTPGSKEGEKISLSSITEGLQNLNSYRSHLRMTFQDSSGGDPQVIEMNLEIVQDPPAQHIIFQNTNTAEQFETFIIGDRQYFLSGEECLSATADEENFLDTSLNPDDIVGDLSGLTRVTPDETINGVLCHHYTFDETALIEAGVTSAQGDVWIAVDGGYVVKYTMQADGTDPETQQEGHIELEYQIRDINASLTIEPPESCGVSGGESEYPIMEDAVNLTTMTGMITYESPSSFDEVLAFYQEQMPAHGWSDTGDSFITDGTAVLVYGKDGNTVNITITAGDETVSVLLFSE